MIASTLARVPFGTHLFNWLGPRLVHGAFWSLVGTVISRALSLGSSVVVARWLGKESFGEFGIMQSTLGMFAIFAGFGMGMTATKHVAELRQTDPARAGRLIGLSNWVAWIAGGLMMFVLFLAAEPVASHTLAAPQLTPYLRLCAPLILLGSLNGAQMGVLTGFEAFKRITQVNIVSALISFPLIAVGAWRLDLDGALFGLLLGQTVTWLITGVAVRRETARARVLISHRCVWSEARVLWEFSLPSVLTGTLLVPVNWACAALLVNQPAGYGEMGIFNVASQWRGFAMLIPNTLIGISLPVLSNMVGNKDRVGHQQTTATTIKLNVAITSALAVCIGAASPVILKMYGPQYESGVWCICLLVSSTIPGAYSHAIYQVLASHGKMWACAATLAVWAAISVSLTVWLVPFWRKEGLALATLLAQTFYALLLYLYMGRNSWVKPTPTPDQDCPATDTSSTYDHPPWPR